MDLPTFHWLLSSEGQRALAEAADLPLTDASRLADLTRLRRVYPPDQAAAALETARLRRLAAAKFTLAGRMYFTREALEQATGEVVAARAASRFARFGRVADLCCGIGGDTIALARVTRVVAVERDPVRLAMAGANLAAHGLAERVELVQADVTEMTLPPVEAIFVDPARRAGGRRVFSLANYVPPFGLVARWAAQVGAAGVKVAPGLADEEIPDGWEAEFVALGRDLKQALLWFGHLRTAARRATLLPENISLASATGQDRPIPQGEPRGVLYEPNPALMRARLLAGLAERLDAWQIDPTIAYLCADAWRETPLARAYRVEEWLPFNLKALNRRLRERGVGAVVVKKRGSPLDPQAFERRLRLAGPERRVVVLTRVAGQPAIILCHAADGDAATADPASVE